MMATIEALESLDTDATFTTAEARDAGLHWRDLYAMRDRGEIIELSRGVYRHVDAPLIGQLDLIALTKRVPHGMVCLTSALAYWDLTDEIPRAVHFAVPRGSRPPIIDYPPADIHVFDAETFELGRSIERLEASEAIAISTRERSIIDVMRFRNQIGRDIAFASMREYLNRPGAEPGRLVELARELRVAGPVRDALEILLS